jgi:hypothetical protein
MTTIIVGFNVAMLRKSTITILQVDIDDWRGYL